MRKNIIILIIFLIFISTTVTAELNIEGELFSCVYVGHASPSKYPGYIGFLVTGLHSLINNWYIGLKTGYQPWYKYHYPFKDSDTPGGTIGLDKYPGFNPDTGVISLYSIPAMCVVQYQFKNSKDQKLIPRISAFIGAYFSRFSYIDIYKGPSYFQEINLGFGGDLSLLYQFEHGLYVSVDYGLSILYDSMFWKSFPYLELEYKKGLSAALLGISIGKKF